MDVESATLNDKLAKNSFGFAWDGHVILIQNFNNGKSGKTSDLNAQFFKFKDDTFSSVCTVPIPTHPKTIKTELLAAKLITDHSLAVNFPYVLFRDTFPLKRGEVVMYRVGFFDILEENKPFVLCKEFQLPQINEVHLLDGPTMVFVDSEKFQVMHCTDPFSASQENEDSDDENEKMDIELGSNPWQTFEIPLPKDFVSCVYFGLFMGVQSSNKKGPLSSSFASIEVLVAVKYEGYKWKVMSLKEEGKKFESWMGIPGEYARSVQCMCVLDEVPIEYSLLAMNLHKAACFIIGTSDKKLLEFRYGVLERSHDLKDVPQKIYEMKGSAEEDVFVVQYSNSVQVLSSLNLNTIQEFENKNCVLLSDFFDNGGEQLVLLNVTEQLKSANDLVNNFVLTDGSNNTVIVNSQRKSNTKSDNTTNFDSLLKSLDNRIQIGMKEIETMEKTITEKEKLLKTVFQYMQDLVHFPDEKPSMPLFTDLVPLLDNASQSPPKPSTKQIPKTFLVESFDWSCSSQHIVVHAEIRNNISKAVEVWGLAANSASHSLETQSRSETCILEPGKTTALSAKIKVATTTQAKCGIDISVHWSSNSQVVLAEDMITSLYNIGTFVVTPADMLGLTSKSSYSKPTFFSKADLLFLSTSHKSDDIVKMFKDALELRVAVSQIEPNVLLESEENCQVPIRAEVIPVNKQTHVSVHTSSLNSLANVLQIIKTLVPEEMTVVQDPFANNALDRITAFIKSFQTELTLASKHLSKFKKPKLSRDEVKEFLQFRIDYAATQSQTDFLFSQITQVSEIKQ